MTLYETIALLEDIAAAQPAVNCIVQRDVFKLNERPDMRYGAFAWVQGVHAETVANDIRQFSFNLFYIDRLTPSKDNELEVQSVGVEVLGNIIRTVAEELGVGAWQLHPFTQRFKDECAGVWASVTLDVPVSFPCAETWPEYVRTRGSFSEAFDASFQVWKRTYFGTKEITVI